MCRAFVWFTPNSKQPDPSVIKAVFAGFPVHIASIDRVGKSAVESVNSCYVEGDKL